MDIQELKAFPDKKYNVIYADPPWSYKDKSKSHGGGAESHYQCMEINEICKLEIGKIKAMDSILFMWVTFPQLCEGFKVIESWGFTYKTCAFVWVKTNKRSNNKQYNFLPETCFDDFMGMGRWTRANAEICLLATSGKPKRISPNVRQIIYEPIEGHSKKPNMVKEKIVELVGNLPRIELFAREKTPGWDVWGNEV